MVVDPQHPPVLEAGPNKTAGDYVYFEPSLVLGDFSRYSQQQPHLTMCYRYLGDKMLSLTKPTSRFVPGHYAR